MKTVLLVLEGGKRGGREPGWIDDSPQQHRGVLMARQPCLCISCFMLCASGTSALHKDTGRELVPARLGSLSFLNREQFWDIRMLGKFPHSFWS